MSSLAGSPTQTLALLDAVPDAIVLVDARACVTFANRSALDLFGYPAEELIGSSAERLMPERYRGRAAIRKRVRALSGEGPAGRGPSIELKGLHRDGHEFPVEVFVAEAQLDGSVLALATIREIAEGAHSEAVERLVAAVQSSSDAIFTTDLRGTITTWNRGAEGMYGLSEQDAVGSSVSVLMDAERAAEMPAIIARITAGDYINQFETVRLRADGTPLDVSLSISPVSDAQGRIVGAATVARDITERKRADETWRALLESAPDAVVVVGAEGRMVFVNRQTEELFGHPRHELLGQAVEMLLPEHMREFGAHSVGGFADPDSRHTGAALELCGLRADGTEFPIEITFSPLHAPGGVLVYAAIRDITERNVIDEELRRSNRDLEQFAYVASHDLSEPLRVIAGFVDLLARRYRGQLDADADKFIDFVVSGVERMQALIDDLLAYSRAGRGQLEVSSVDTEAVVREVLWTLEPQVTAQHVAVEVDKLPTVRAEPALLRQILQNLISNAIKFSDAEQPRVAVRARRRGEGWQFDVEDNGPGIEPRHTERVFEMFQRLHGREVAGSGMGLAIVKRLTERHGGRVWVSPAEPRGSVFSFTIPERGQRA